MTDTNAYMEYLRLHVITLEQHLEQISEEMEQALEGSTDFTELDYEYNHTAGQLLTARHFLAVYGDYLYNGNLSEGA